MSRAAAPVSLEELRRRALQEAPASATPAQRIQNVYTRSASVKAYVLKRADGTCESCLIPAPFTRIDGTPYLEPHHIRRLADGGPDHPSSVAAICPTCHRRVHHGADGNEVNRRLAERVATLEKRAVD
ncbi:HNH endonuclease [Gemmatimonas groenlandica]|uniref:HNH endonuclease n=1 Tax=Gemmatimonas groenlandica TaxID=2732249 RepID=UPI003CCD7626